MPTLIVKNLGTEEDEFTITRLSVEPNPNYCELNAKKLQKLFKLLKMSEILNLQKLFSVGNQKLNEAQSAPLEVTLLRWIGCVIFGS